MAAGATSDEMGAGSGLYPKQGWMASTLWFYAAHRGGNARMMVCMCVHMAQRWSRYTATRIKAPADMTGQSMPPVAVCSAADLQQAHGAGRSQTTSTTTTRYCNICSCC